MTYQVHSRNMGKNYIRPQITENQRDKAQEYADEYLPVDADGMTFEQHLDAILHHLDQQQDQNDTLQRSNPQRNPSEYVIEDADPVGGRNINNQL